MILIFLIVFFVCKISGSFLEEASLLFNREEAVLQTESKLIANSNSDLEDMALVGLDAMQRANSTLEDFVSRVICFF
jgi:hypothetical protein